MYDVGKVLIVGGGDPPTRTAEIIDLEAHNPRWGYVERYVRAIGGTGRSSELQVVAFEPKLQREQ